MRNSALAATRKCGIFCKKESKGRGYTMRRGRSIAIAGRNRGAALRKPQIRENIQAARGSKERCHLDVFIDYRTNTKGQAKRMLLQNSYFSAGRLLSGEQRRPAALSSAFS